VALQECLSLEILRVGERIVVPTRAVGFDYKPLPRPAEVGDDNAAFELERLIHLGALEASGNQEVEYNVLEF
jgi:hypothetical protein